MGKTNADHCKNYYNRKKAAKEAEKARQGLSVNKPIRKTGAERNRAYRLRKKMLLQVDNSSVAEILSTPSTSSSRIRTFAPSFRYCVHEMEGDSRKVFVSGITRNPVKLCNNLYDVIKKEVIQPTSVITEVQDECEFQPNNQKMYVPKRKSKLKVITLRDIRNLFEKDNIECLSFELERQQQYLLRKIRDGNANDESTKKVALNLLKSDKPISRTSWQMLMNINPEGHSHCSQFILWNGKCIQINGSKGGKNKFVCNFDIKKCPESALKARSKVKLPTRKRALLRDSLSIKFKPGPLRRKKDLDYSYQKYNVGDLKLINLPNIGLHIQPSYGKALEPTISTFLQHVLAKDGTISEKWAEYAGSVLGKVTTEGAQICEDNSVTINLSYKYDQKLMLMRDANDEEKNVGNSNMCNKPDTSLTNIDTEIMENEIKSIVNRMLDCVEVSLNQDCIYTGTDEPRESTISYSNCDATSSNVKEKEKKRKYCELDRLDVTIIRISEKRQRNNAEPCSQLFCALGCVCESLEYKYLLKDHCGRIDCMFGCNCDFSKFNMTESLEGNCSEFIPGLYYLDKKINDKLSKEEQKFHQTVIVTEDKSILLKSKRRNWKTSKKYADFYSNMPLRSEIKNQKYPTIIITKLKCENIEPWCMVHNLYKCFCKGKLTQRYLENTPVIEKCTNTTNSNDADQVVPIEIKQDEPPITTSKNTQSAIDTIVIDGEIESSEYLHARRVHPYEGRKYSDEYYRRTNEKIFEMEKNDKKLHSKMMTLLNGSEENAQNNENSNSNKKLFDVANAPFKLDELLDNIVQERERLMDTEPEENVVKTNKVNKVNFLPNKLKLGEWLEISYKKYKEQIDKGDCKISLSPPSPGKCALYPWEFILSRYQQRKNLFLISIGKPYRIFMAVDAKHPFFERCINVAHIPESSLNEYPIMVNYLRNNVKNLKDNFCILCGLSLCWELIGSVNKVNENKSTITLESESNLEKDKINVKTLKKKQNENVPNVSLDVTSTPDSNESRNREVSKWFVMTVEKDFNEIQFYNKRFYVKYDSIMKSIDVARRVGKTVRLSTQKCQENSNNTWPQFGIYAAPDIKENSVFIGPYETDEPLGIETVKDCLEITLDKKTRGSWITVNKVDNLKVIDNPLSYIPSHNDDSIETLDKSTDCDVNKSKGASSLSENPVVSNESSPSKDTNTAEKGIKLLKPIKIRKTNGFYQIAPQSILRGLSLQKCLQKSKQLSELGGGTASSSKSNNFQSLCSLLPQFKQLKSIPKNQPNKPVAEIAPLIKLTNIGSLCSKNASAELSITERKAKGGGMFVLKPDEINERLVASNYFRIMQPTDCETSATTIEGKKPARDTSSLDIEEFLDTSLICSAPASDVYVISDDEDVPETPIRDVWITCENITSIGWILGRKNNDNKLSFEFPGFAFSNFYDERQAFNKINQVFSRKIYVPKNVAMKWRVIEKEEDLGERCKLRPEDLNPCYVLTKQGLTHKDNLILKKKKTEQKTSDDSATSTQTMEVVEIADNEIEVIPANDPMDCEVANTLDGNVDNSESLTKADCEEREESTENAKSANKEGKIKLNQKCVTENSMEIDSAEAIQVLGADSVIVTDNTKACNKMGPCIEMVTSLKVEKLSMDEDQVPIELD